MKILFLIPTLSRGGAERQLSVLARGLRQRGVTVKILVFYAGGEFQPELEQNGVPVIVLDKTGRWDLLGFACRLVNIIRREKPDILHAYMPVANLLSIILRPFLPRMRVVWGVRAADMDLNQYGWLPKIVFKMQCLLAPFANLIVCNSRAGRAYHILHGFPEHKTTIVANGIDVSKFAPDPVQRGQLRKKWQIGEGHVLVGLVARLDPVKGHPVFLQAAALLVKQFACFKFICIGDGANEYKRQLMLLTRELGLEGHVQWIGEYSDMPAVYSALDIAVNSSMSEGFSNVIGEAMACNVPCIVTDVGDSAWLVGAFGKVVGRDRPEELACAIADLHFSLHSSAIGSPRQWICEQFSVDALVRNTAKVLLRQDA